MLVLPIVVAVIGIAALWKGADLLISSASSMAAKFGVSTAVVGITVVTLGSIAPELSIAVTSSASSANDLIIGNALGSSILKIGLVLGLAAVVSPLAIQASTLRHEFPWLIAAALLAYLLAFDLTISRADAAFLIVVGIAFQWYSVWVSKREVIEEIGKRKAKKRQHETFRTGYAWLKVLFGIVLVVLGAKFFVASSLTIAQALHIPQLLVGIVIIAMGASVPELVVTVMSSARHVPSLGIGNVIGSNVMNIHLVAGIAALIHPLTIHPDLLRFDFPMFVFFTLLVSVMFKSNHKLSRLEGGVLVVGYMVYLAYSIRLWG